jgi:hypothetical protein
MAAQPCATQHVMSTSLSIMSVAVKQQEVLHDASPARMYSDDGLKR